VWNFVGEVDNWQRRNWELKVSIVLFLGGEKLFRGSFVLAWEQV